jgi:hypothetical protein
MVLSKYCTVVGSKENGRWQEGPLTSKSQGSVRSSQALLFPVNLATVAILATTALHCKILRMEKFVLQYLAVALEKPCACPSFSLSPSLPTLNSEVFRLQQSAIRDTQGKSDPEYFWADYSCLLTDAWEERWRKVRGRAKGRYEKKRKKRRLRPKSWPWDRLATKELRLLGAISFLRQD